MSDFAETWRLVRGRFEKEIEGLSEEQRHWRLHKNSLTIAEQSMHVAGVEVSFLSQLSGTELDEFAKRVALSATDGVILTDRAFPFSEEELSQENVDRALALGKMMVAEHIDPLTDEMRAREIKSALGPVIDGTGAFARLAYHPAYHQAQVYQIKTSPDFPA